MSGFREYEGETTRRKVLAGLSAVGGSVIGGFSVERARAATITTYSGTRKREFVPDSSGDFWTHESWFTSSDLEADYGTNTFHVPTEPPLPRNAVPDNCKNPDEKFQVKYSDEAKIATFDEHASVEAQADSSTYSGPRWAYPSSTSNPSKSDLGERKTPITVGWTWSTADNIKSVMQDRGWTSFWADSSLAPKDDRSIIIMIDPSSSEIVPET